MITIPFILGGAALLVAAWMLRPPWPGGAYERRLRAEARYEARLVAILGRALTARMEREVAGRVRAAEDEAVSKVCAFDVCGCTCIWPHCGAAKKPAYVSICEEAARKRSVWLTGSWETVPASDPERKDWDPQGL